MNKTKKREDLMIKYMPQFAQIECNRMMADDDGERSLTAQGVGERNLRSLVDAIKAEPGMSQTQIIKKSGIVRSSVQTHLHRAIEAGILRTVTIGRRKTYYPAVKTVNVNGETK